MTDKTTDTIVTFLLDKSGSMNSCYEATIESFNAYVDTLANSGNPNMVFSLLQFDTGGLEKTCLTVPIANAPRLSRDNYRPRGGTPLIDAAVKTIHSVEKYLSEEGKDIKVIICFQTDGEENSSVEHTWEELKALVTAKEAIGWQFQFMGAGINAYVQSAKMGLGVGSTMSYDHTNIDTTRAAFVASASNTAMYSHGLRDSTQYSVQQRTDSGDVYYPNKISTTNSNNIYRRKQKKFPTISLRG